MLVLLTLLACIENGFDRNRHTDTFTQEPASVVDVLWVIDDSGSMQNEQELIADGFASFIASIEDTNIDYHIGVITTDMDIGNSERGRLLGVPAVLTSEDDVHALFPARAMVGIGGSAKEQGISAALEAVSEPLASGGNAGFLRKDAVLSIIYVSDEEDCSDNGALGDEPPEACYTQYYKLADRAALLADLLAVKQGGGRLLNSAIVGPPPEEACVESWEGTRYAYLVEATGGILGSICEEDYSSILERMGLAVSGVLTTFQLSRNPVEDTIEVSVDEDKVERDAVDGWTFDAENRMLRFDGDYVPPRGSTISVSYRVLSNVEEAP